MMDNRLDSFRFYWPNSHKMDISVAQCLARAGFYLTRHTSSTVCFSCGLRGPLAFWLKGHDPETVHLHESPNCKFIQSDNVPIENKNLNNKQFNSTPNTIQDAIAILDKLKGNENKETRKATDSASTRSQEGDENKKTDVHLFSTKLHPFSVDTPEPNSSPGTQQQRLLNISGASNTSTQIPDSGVKVSAYLYSNNGSS